ncbi:hypothetical protein NQ315_012779 [Exocentrus adspersus]|uniref:Uncharacterized protein n=1 Tax=Exocentrus adspersus TaxID=1586481 RepID=A0AAV8VCY4_9CUCU|nr:hypothetical protein NQ315_012779 [Exocentrus adspersus]
MTINLSLFKIYTPVIPKEDSNSAIGLASASSRTNILQEKYYGLMKASLVMQHDGAGPHNAHVVRNYLDARFPNAWIGTYGPVRWAPRSPCLTPLDYFLWGTIKDKVYSNATNNIEHLRVKIEDAFQSVSQNSVQKAVDQMELRTNLCIRYNGGHINNFQVAAKIQNSDWVTFN